jgi:acetylornithine/succinyldiaminopimelate/putrescine aminotransferase
LDFTSGIGVMSLGFRSQHINDAIIDQLDHCTHTMVYGEHLHASHIRYAKALSARFPHGRDGAPQQAFFVNSGTEAVDLALKMARKISGKKPMVAIKNGFHGRGYGAMSVSWRADYKDGFFADDTTEFIDPEDTLDSWVHPARWAGLGGLILELVQGEAGCIPLDAQWARSLVETAQSAGVPVIIDEIQTGFGRTGTFSAQEQYGVHADITCLGKAGGGGLPFGAVVSAKENFERLQNPPLSHISTFGGNSVVMAAGCAVMDGMTDELFEQVRTNGIQLRGQIRFLAGKFPSIISGVRGTGLMNGLVLRDPAYSQPFYQSCMRRGLILFYKLNAGNVLRMSPPLVISRADIDEAVGIMAAACNELQNRPDLLMDDKQEAEERTAFAVGTGNTL